MNLFIDCTRFFLQHVGSLSFLAAHVIFSCMWDLSPWSGIKPGPPALGPWSLSHWTTREYPCSSVAKLCPALSDCMNYRCQTSLSFTIPQNLLKLMSVELVMPSNHLILWCPLLPSSLSAFNFSQHQGLSQWVGSLHQVTKVLELQLQHQSFQWIFRVDFL